MGTRVVLRRLRRRHGLERAALRALFSALALCALAGSVSAGCIPLVRIGLEPEVAEIRVSAKGLWHLGIEGSRLRPATIAASEEWTVRARGDSILVTDAAGRRRGVVADTLFAFPDDAESGSLIVNGTSYRGQMLLWASGGRVTAINVIDLESYLCAVLPRELGPQPFERLEALKAQAVAARSYTLANLGRWTGRGFDLLPTVEDQVYGGIPAERPVCSQACEDTRGVVAIYDGAPIRAYYCSTCGGHTSAPEEVWSRPAAPYLQPVPDTSLRVDHAFCSPSPWFSWKEEWNGKELESVLRASIPRLRSGWSAAKAGRLKEVSIEGRSASNRVSCLRLSFQHGSVDLRGDEIRYALRRRNGDPLRSALVEKVEVARKRGVITHVRVKGRGFGHGVGMCQFGAMGMAEAGYTYDQILRFYYRGAELRRFY